MEDNLITNYVGNIEISMTLEDAKHCSHQGHCDEDVKEVLLQPYIQQQLKNYSNKEMEQELKEYAIEDVETFDRQTLEEYIIWLVAGNIMDEI